MFGYVVLIGEVKNLGRIHIKLRVKGCGVLLQKQVI
jgi:hypothetical protein